MGQALLKLQGIAWEARRGTEMTALDFNTLAAGSRRLALCCRLVSRRRPATMLRENTAVGTA